MNLPPSLSLVTPISLQTVRDQLQCFRGDPTTPTGEHCLLLLSKEGGVSEVFLWRPESKLLAAGGECVQPQPAQVDEPYLSYSW